MIFVLLWDVKEIKLGYIEIVLWGERLIIFCGCVVVEFCCLVKCLCLGGIVRFLGFLIVILVLKGLFKLFLEIVYCFV